MREPGRSERQPATLPPLNLLLRREGIDLTSPRFPELVPGVLEDLRTKRDDGELDAGESVVVNFLARFQDSPRALLLKVRQLTGELTEAERPALEEALRTMAQAAFPLDAQNQEARVQELLHWKPPHMNGASTPSA